MLITGKEVWEKFRLSRPTLFDLVKEGYLTDYKTPKGHRRYDEKEIIKTLKQSKTDSSTGGPAVG